ncbi:hypothetical protein IW262DRAFT_22081 [Armillaria fumosa]|nr:hypothetical protein IW262DRAFT_22081 [Armillaria fumosa]
MQRMDVRGCSLRMGVPGHRVDYGRVFRGGNGPCLDERKCFGVHGAGERRRLAPRTVSRHRQKVEKDYAEISEQCIIPKNKERPNASSRWSWLYISLVCIQKNQHRKYPRSPSCLPSRTCDAGVVLDQYFCAVPAMLDAGQFPCRTGKTCPGEYSIILLRRPPTCRTSALRMEECEESCFAIRFSFCKQVRIRLRGFESGISRFDVKGPVQPLPRACCLSRSLLHEKVLHCLHHLFILLGIPSTCAYYSKHATVAHALIRAPPPNRTKSFLHSHQHRR